MCLYRNMYNDGYSPIRQARFEKAKKLGVINERTVLSAQAGGWEKMEHKAWETRMMQTYAAMVTVMDRGIGQIIETLQKEGRLENTLIFFLQDNGACAETPGRTEAKNRTRTNNIIPNNQPQWHGREHTRDGRAVRTGPSVMPGPDDTFVGYGKAWANVSNTPFREYKQFMHEGGISTPLIAYWPKGITKKGELRHTPGHIIDIMATCVDIADAEYPKVYAEIKIQAAEGRSLRPIFKQDCTEKRTLFFEHMGHAAIRKGKWKLVGKKMVSKKGIKQTGWELFNINKDRSEQYNLSSKYPDKVNELIHVLESEANRVRSIPSPIR